MCADYLQAHELTTQQEKDSVPSRPKLPKSYPSKQLEWSSQSAGIITMSQEDLRSLTRAGDDEQKEILPSNLCIATSGRHPQAPAVVSALREASIPLRMEPAKPCEQKEQDPSLDRKSVV